MCVNEPNQRDRWFARLLNRFLALVALAIGAFGCTSLHLKPGEIALRKHAVFVGSSGQPKAAWTKIEAKARGVDTDANLSRDGYNTHLRDIVEAIRMSGRDTILLFIHGGRVGLRQGAEESYALLERMSSANTSAYFPLFIVWDASDLTSFGGHLRYRRGIRSGVVRTLVTMPLTLAEDLGRAALSLPFTAVYQLQDYCRSAMRGLRGGGLPSDASCFVGSDVAERRRLRPIELSSKSANANSSSSASVPPITDSLIVSWGRYRSSWWRTSGAVTKTIISAAPRLVTGAFVDGVGSGLWDDMVRRTSVMFRPDAERVEMPERLGGYRAPSGAAASLLTTISTMLVEDSVAGRRKRTIVIAGHSMGAIVASNILQRYPSLPVARIQFLAAASSVTDLENSVIPYLRANKQTTFEMATLHPFAETGEQNGIGFGPTWMTSWAVPQASLLEWIDNYFERARSPFDRRAGKWRNAALGLHVFPNDLRRRVCLKAFGLREPSNADTPYFELPAKHGQFNDPGIAFWSRKFWQVENRGTPVYLAISEFGPVTLHACEVVPAQRR